MRDKDLFRAVRMLANDLANSSAKNAAKLREELHLAVRRRDADSLVKALIVCMGYTPGGEADDLFRGTAEELVGLAKETLSWEQWETMAPAFEAPQGPDIAEVLSEANREKWNERLQCFMRFMREHIKPLCLAADVYDSAVMFMLTREGPWWQDLAVSDIAYEPRHNRITVRIIFPRGGGSASSHIYY